MKVIVAYDVKTIEKKGRRRLRKVAEACEDHGARVQKSLFECDLPERLWRGFRAKLLGIYEPDEDSLRFYFLCVQDGAKTEHHGIGKPPSLDAPLIF